MRVKLSIATAFLLQLKGHRLGFGKKLRDLFGIGRLAAFETGVIIRKPAIRNPGAAHVSVL